MSEDTQVQEAAPEITQDVPVDYNFGESRTAKKLQLEPLMQDFDMEAKVRTIDKYIDEDAEPELRNSDVGYELGLERMMQRLGMSYMEEMKKGNNLKILERLFSSVAIRDKVSSGTFLTKVREAVRTGKVNRLRSELKALGNKKVYG